MRIKASELINCLLQDEDGIYKPEKDTIVQIYHDGFDEEYWYNVNTVIIHGECQYKIFEINNYSFYSYKEIEIRILKDITNEIIGEV